jgi:hypothetical protein
MTPRARSLAATTCIVVLLLAAALVWSGCSGSAGGATTTIAAITTSIVAPETTSTIADTTTTTALMLEWGEKGTWQDISVTVDAPQLDPTPESVDAGNKVVYCMVKIVNNSKDPFDFNGLDFMLFDAAHEEYDNFGLTSKADLAEGTLAPGGTATGAVAFEMPESAAPSGVEWQPQTEAAPVLIWGQP